MFKFLLILILIIAFVAPVRRFVFWLLVGRQLAKEQRRTSGSASDRREGSTNVDYVPPKPGESRFKGGEYVDYEEVK